LAQPFGNHPRSTDPSLPAGTVTVPTMHDERFAPYAEGPGYR
jgi:hypothetical protein